MIQLIKDEFESLTLEWSVRRDINCQNGELEYSHTQGIFGKKYVVDKNSKNEHLETFHPERQGHPSRVYILGNTATKCGRIFLDFGQSIRRDLGSS